MTNKCRWCHGTGLYYPLVGEAEPCRECSQPEKTIFIPKMIVPAVPDAAFHTLTWLGEPVQAGNVVPPDGTFIGGEALISQPNLDLINQMTMQYIRQSNLVERIFTIPHLWLTPYETEHKLKVFPPPDLTYADFDYSKPE